MDREKALTITKKDLRIETFKSGGKGGQGRDKRDTAVRITHIPSGATGSSQDSRKQSENKKQAFLRMANNDKFRVWVRKTVAGMDDAVNRAAMAAMEPQNLKIEVRENGKWIEKQ